MERQAVNSKLELALKTPGKQVVVYGHSGSGKSTLLINKLDAMGVGFISTHCTSDLSFDEMLLQAFDQLDTYFIDGSQEKEQQEIASSLKADYKAISSELTASITTVSSKRMRRVVPPQLTLQRLGEFIGATGQCWVLEDFHKMDTASKTRLGQAMKVFMDLSKRHPMLKIIAIGAVGTARQIVKYEPEMSNRVAEVHVPLMSPAELNSVVSKGQSLLNVAFHRRVRGDLISFSHGLAAVCHQLCLNMC